MHVTLADAAIEREVADIDGGARETLHPDVYVRIGEIDALRQ